MQHLQVGYSDILMMPTNERRFYLGLLLKSHHAKEDKQQEGGQISGGKGTRTQKIGGETLKNKIKSGQIPLQ